MKDRHIVTVFGEPIEILVSSKSTNYTCCTGVQTSPPGGGPPPHKHEREEETFLVLEGEYEFFIDGEWVPLHQGDVICSLRGTYHAFRNVGTTPGRIMFTTNAGGLDEYFEQISPLTLPNDMDHLAEISRHYGYVFLSPEQSLPQPEPHEAWHVSQQEQGRVRPLSAIAGASVNDDRGLEREADRMGSNAAKQPKQN